MLDYIVVEKPNSRYSLCVFIGTRKSACSFAASIGVDVFHGVPPVVKEGDSVAVFRLTSFDVSDEEKNQRKALAQKAKLQRKPKEKPEAGAISRLTKANRGDLRKFRKSFFDAIKQHKTQQQTEPQC